MIDNDDPRKEGIPSFLQVQNRRPMTEEDLMRYYEKYGPRPTTPWGTRPAATAVDLKAAEEIKAEKKRIAELKFKARIAKANDKERNEWFPGAVWDQSTCKWINREENNMRKSGEKTVAELTKEFNAIAASKGKKPVKLFRDRKTALKRLEEINGSTPPKTMSKKEDGSERKTIIEMFSFRKGSEREVLLDKLIDHLDEMVSKKSLGDCAVSISGIEWRIKGSPGKDGVVTTKKLPFEIRTSKDEKGKYYGLYRVLHK